MIRAEDRPSRPGEWAQAADLVMGVTARAFQVPEACLRLRQRSRSDIAFARQVAMYLVHIVFGGTYKQVGALFGRERTTVAYACALVEDERDDAALDGKLDLLEEAIVRLWAIERLRRVRRARAEAKDRAAA